MFDPSMGNKVRAVAGMKLAGYLTLLFFFQIKYFPPYKLTTKL